MLNNAGRCDNKWVMLLEKLKNAELLETYRDPMALVGNEFESIDQPVRWITTLKVRRVLQ